MTTGGGYFVALITPFFVSCYHLRVSFDGSSLVLVQFSQTFSTKYVKFFGKKDNFSSYGSRKTSDNDSLQMTKELNGKLRELASIFSVHSQRIGGREKTTKRENFKFQIPGKKFSSLRIWFFREFKLISKKCFF